MIKVQLKKREEKPVVKFSYEDDYIPFSIIIGNTIELPETIYTRNLSGENFIEFRFVSNSKSLYEVTLVAVQRDTVVESETFTSNILEDGYFDCLIEDNIEVEFSSPIRIYRSESSVCLDWHFEESPISKYFPLSQNCIIGVDASNCLTSIALVELSKNDIHNIFGF